MLSRVGSGATLVSLLATALTLAQAPLVVGADPPPPETSKAGESDLEEVSETFLSHGKKVAVERFAPRAPGRYPLVLILHGHGGIGPAGGRSPLRDEARLLARQGYVALIPHYFDRTAGAKLNNAVRNARYYKIWMETVADAVTYGGRLPQVDRRHVGLIGHSLGASVVISNGLVDARVSAVVEYAGSLVFIDGPPLEPPAMPPTLILHGDADSVVPVREARKLAAALDEWQTPYEAKIYPGAGHGFRGNDAEDAWKRTREFLARHLKGNP
jgi:carboxymethylenebutenolidase